MVDELSIVITQLIHKDLADVLKNILDDFSIDTYEEPLFELAFKSHKLNCAKVILDRGISEQRLTACIGSTYDLNRYTKEQINFLIQNCNIDPAFIKK